MLPENKIRELYNDRVEFLERQDARTPEEVEAESIEAIEAYEAAVHEYELLHKILEVPGEPKWCS